MSDDWKILDVLQFQKEMIIADEPQAGYNGATRSIVVSFLYFKK